MKYFNYLVTVLIIILVSCQNTSVSILVVSTDLGGKNEFRHSPNMDTLQFYQNGEIMYTICPINTGDVRLIKDFKCGTYDVHYINHERLKITKVVSIKENEDFSLDLPPFVIQSYPDNTLSNLKNNDSLSISFLSVGCFHKISRTLTFQKKNENYLIKLCRDGKEYEKTFKELDTSIYNNFERSLLSIHNHSRGTTSEFCTISSKSFNLKVSNDSIGESFYSLTKKIFGKLQ